VPAHRAHMTVKLS